MQKFKIGQHVKSQLKFRFSEWNNQKGEITAYDPDTQRYQVKLKNPVLAPGGRHMSHWYHESELR